MGCRSAFAKTAHALAILIALALVAACARDRAPELYGAWQAVLLTENGDTVDVVLDDVTIAFREDGTYAYTSKLDYVEEGTFRAENDRLYTTPTAQDTLVDRPVEIAALAPDLLILNMMEGQARRTLTFERVIATASDEATLLETESDHDDEHDHEH